jgi:hypothetical protein
MACLRAEAAAWAGRGEFPRAASIATATTGATATTAGHGLALEAIHHLAQVCKSLELCKEHGGGLWIVNSVGDHVQLQTRALRLKAAGKLQSRGEVGG